MIMKLVCCFCCICLALAGQTDRVSKSRVSVVFPNGLEGAARRVRAQHQALASLVERRLECSLPENIEVRLTANHDNFNATIRGLGGQDRPSHIAAVAFPYKDVIVMKTPAWIQGKGGFNQLYLHELTHCALGKLRQKRLVDIPRWFEEGLAQFVAEDVFRGDPGQIEAALATGDIIPFKTLEESFPEQEGASALAYAQSLSLVRFLHTFQTDHPERHRRLPAILRQLSRGHSFSDVLMLATGLEIGALEAAWLGEVRAEGTIPARQLPSFVFGGFLLVITALLFARNRVRRQRTLESMGSDEGWEGEDQP